MGKLEKATLGALLAAALLSITSITISWLQGGRPLIASTPTPGLVGKSDLSKLVNRSHSGVTLVVGMSLGCPACRSSLPIVRGILKDFEHRGKPIDFVVVAREPERAVRQALRASSLEPARVADWGEFGGKVKFVPTVFLLDRRGTAVYEQVGRVTEDQRERLMAAATSN